MNSTKGFGIQCHLHFKAPDFHRNQHQWLQIQLHRDHFCHDSNRLNDHFRFSRSCQFICAFGAHLPPASDWFTVRNRKTNSIVRLPSEKRKSAQQQADVEVECWWLGCHLYKCSLYYQSLSWVKHIGRQAPGSGLQSAKLGTKQIPSPIAEFRLLCLEAGSLSCTPAPLISLTCPRPLHCGINHGSSVLWRTKD